MINIKSSKEIEIMATGGKIASLVIQEVLRQVKPGIATLELDRLAENRIRGLGGTPSFKGFEGYEFSTCINLNDGIVHGIPSKTVIGDGDVVSIDLGVIYKGFHTDTSWTVVAGSSDAWKEKFLSAGKRALEKSIKAFRKGGRIGDISAAMQTEIEAVGYNVVRDLVGHGVGRELHEPPQVPCYGKKGSGPVLKKGMVLAIEVIYTFGDWHLRVLPDGWTMATKDGKISGLFEQTVALTAQGPKVLTEISPE
ncbi:MAG: type I methionyl aminopeptidase [Patescibacteria group bacterium]|nr:type I methionyl aminopeptidase [Patescibacteria group bacterium]